MSDFEKELVSLINSHSLENDSDTPDFLLGCYLMHCLATWNDVTKARDKWFGFEPSQFEGAILT